MKICGIKFVDEVAKHGKVWTSQASGDPETPQRDRNNLPDFLRAMPMQVSAKYAKISN